MWRRLLFQTHRRVGLGAGIYLVAIGITGAALVFRQDMQAAVYPEFFDVDRGGAREAEPALVLRALEAAYPGYRVSGLDWPTYRRGTFLAYVSHGDEFKTVFAHPVSGQVTGELPFDAIRWLQELHFNLLGGPTGLMINGIGAALLLAMCISGLVIWWPGAARWARALRVDVSRGWKRVIWDLHGAIGMWLWAFIVMWALTGIYFAFPQPFRRTVNAVSPLTVVRAPESDLSGARVVPGSPQASSLQPGALIARARQAVPDGRIARFVFPYGNRGAYQLVMARAVHGDYDTTDEVTLYFDQYTGALLLTRDHARRSGGDALTAWIGPLHTGTLGGLTVKVLWAIVALALPVLFITGGTMWWNRVR